MEQINRNYFRQKYIQNQNQMSNSVQVKIGSHRFVTGPSDRTNKNQHYLHQTNNQFGQSCGIFVQNYPTSGTQIIKQRGNVGFKDQNASSLETLRKKLTKNSQQSARVYNNLFNLNPCQEISFTHQHPYLTQSSLNSKKINQSSSLIKINQKPRNFNRPQSQSNDRLHYQIRQKNRSQISSNQAQGVDKHKIIQDFSGLNRCQSVKVLYRNTGLHSRSKSDIERQNLQQKNIQEHSPIMNLKQFGVLTNINITNGFNLPKQNKNLLKGSINISLQNSNQEIKKLNKQVTNKTLKIQQLQQKTKRFESRVQLFQLMQKSLKQSIIFNQKLKKDLQNTIQKYKKSEFLVRQLENKIIQMSEYLFKQQKKESQNELLARKQRQAKQQKQMKNMFIHRNLETIFEHSEQQRYSHSNVSRNSQQNLKQHNKIQMIIPLKNGIINNSELSVKYSIDTDLQAIYLSRLAELLNLQDYHTQSSYKEDCFAEEIYNKIKDKILQLLKGAQNKVKIQDRKDNLSTVNENQHNESKQSDRSFVISSNSPSKFISLQNIQAQYKQICQIFDVRITGKNYHERLLLEINQFRENIKALLNSFDGFDSQNILRLRNENGQQPQQSIENIQHKMAKQTDIQAWDLTNRQRKRQIRYILQQTSEIKQSPSVEVFNDHKLRKFIDNQVLKRSTASIDYNMQNLSLNRQIR